MEELLCKTCRYRGKCHYSEGDSLTKIPCSALVYVKILYEYKDWLSKAVEEFKEGYSYQYLSKKKKVVEELINTVEGEYRIRMKK